MLHLDLEELDHFQTGASRTSHGNKRIVVRFIDFFDASRRDFKPFRGLAITGHHDAIRKPQRQHCRGKRHCLHQPQLAASELRHIVQMLEREKMRKIMPQQLKEARTS